MFTPENIARCSLACMYMCEWVLAVQHECLNPNERSYNDPIDLASFNTLSRADITEIRAFKSPSKVVLTVCQAIAICLGIKDPTW